MIIIILMACLVAFPSLAPLSLCVPWLLARGGVDALEASAGKPTTGMRDSATRFPKFRERRSA